MLSKNFSASPQKAALGLATRDPLASGCPARGAEKGNENDGRNQKQSRIGSKQGVGVLGSPIAAVVTSPGMIHEGYNRFQANSISLNLSRSIRAKMLGNGCGFRHRINIRPSLFRQDHFIHCLGCSVKSESCAMTPDITVVEAADAVRRLAVHTGDASHHAR